MSKLDNQLKDPARRNFALGATFGMALGMTKTTLANEDVPKQMKNQTTKEVYMPANDRLDIIELMAVYAWSYDCSDVKGFANTFTPDGSIDIFGKELAKGRESMQGFLDTAFEMRGEHGWQHLTDHHHFQNFDGQSCTVYSYYLMPESDGNGANITLRAMGYYISHCVKDGHKWFFKKREVHRWNGEIPWMA